MQNKEVLNEWDRYCKMVSKGEHFKDFGFDSKAKSSDVNRLNARFSFMQEFESIKLKNYEDNTSDGYALMMKVTILWGTIEALFRVSGKNRSDLDKYCKKIILIDLRKQYVYDIFKVIRDADGTNVPHKKHIDRFLTGKDFSLSYLLTGIRNTFAHGVLTPHSGKKKPNHIIDVCNKLLNFYVPIINTEFTKMVEAHQNHGDYKPYNKALECN